MSAVRFDRILRRMESSVATEFHQQQESAALAPQAIHRLFAVSSRLPAASEEEGRRSKGRMQAVNERRRSSSVELNEIPGRGSQIGGTRKVLQKWKNVVHSGGKEGSTTSKVTESRDATAPVSHS